MASIQKNQHPVIELGEQKANVDGENKSGGLEKSTGDNLCGPA